ncbi:hypothetical protein [Blastococcus sp. CCUG 61487]|uniref:hypothetical protein n=1 Tax=Blastococcus sp. CCUG 61487 TaxID=1840703 RepID=UPI0010C04AC3|nr:hypothetical protein [Blastococcus sp. CCUG 61487]TKJ34213.1 hypothetical protein A6V29_15225 [Blastococcus sp. CCUG 61487]
MADATPTTTSTRTDPTRPRVHPTHSALVGLTSLGVLLQALWAALFMRGDYDTWAPVHQHGGEATVLLAFLATVAAFVWLRHRVAVLVGTALLFVLLLVNMLLGMDGGDAAVIIHIPLAMLIMGLAVWLPTQARR